MSERDGVGEYQEPVGSLAAHRLECPREIFWPSHVEHLRARLAHEYESFLAAVADWARVKEQWLEEKKRAVLEQWEHVDLQKKLRDIERALGAQRRRMRVLRAQLAY